MKKLVTLFILMLSFPTWSADKIYTGIFSSKALSGYDTVAYFTQGKPVKGDSQFQTEYQDANWYFASQEHLDAFKADPERYAPQYGGYCAWAVSAKNDFASADPKQWAIVDGKLYLNYDAEVKSWWDDDRSGHIKQADINWPKLIQ
ncbi:YHS domain-containing (seleno)protein [Vibrio ostreicida]|uniref:YHS domain-containing (Seleno)protein n=1 Tax=Vibrio ostreicida TaxID=526588 RepID=A0ABT8BYQ9_9VIBR|nr:YHS domain-containing (seleno)protein [Vibrio ostreicida]MDN3612226.1 YHS domain-containing (seleno)protein [Vibrio ostreicida]NPD08616.1 YHS domain-containing protein [Vibrio ostreicida]